jgi:hypothetical protein
MRVCVREFYKFLPYEAEEPEINGIINSSAVRLFAVLVFPTAHFNIPSTYVMDIACTLDIT